MVRVGRRPALGRLRLTSSNLDTLRRYHERLNEQGEVALEYVHPDVEVQMFRGSPIPGPYVSHEGLRRWRKDVSDVIEDWRLEIDEIIETEHTDLPANSSM